MISFLNATKPRETRIASSGTIQRIVTRLDALVGPDDSIERDDGTPRPFNWSAFAAIIGSMSLGLIFIAIGQGAGRRDDYHFTWFYWLGLITIVFPTSIHLAGQKVDRNERLILLCGVALSLFLVKLIYSPSGFAHFDEFLHWSAAIDMMDSGRLFTPNPLLPVGPFYPALEIVTTSVASLTRLSLFDSASVVIALSRCLTVLAVFLLIERLMRSARIASLACLAFMTNPNVIFFHGQFAYESLAFTIFAAILYIQCGRRTTKSEPHESLFLTLPLIIALTFTHHVTAYITGGILVGYALLDHLRRDRLDDRKAEIGIAAVALLSPIVWSWRAGAVSHSGSLLTYLGPILQAGAHEFLSLIQGIAGRRLFASHGGLETPLWMRLLSMGSALITSIAIGGAFFTAIAQSASKPNWHGVKEVIERRWRSSEILLLSLLGAAFPLSILLRLTSTGWEIGFRMTPFVYIGVAFLGGISLARLLLHRPSHSRRALAASLITICVLGGLISGWGVPCQRRGYMVVADALSVEPMGIAAAKWMLERLGPGNKVAADRINSLLVTTYGRQSPVVGVDIAHIFTSKIFATEQIESLKRNRLDYLFVDLRLTSGLSQVGIYFDKGEYLGPQLGPPRSSSFLKFNAMPEVSRVFDDGSIVIFDVRKLYEIS